MCFFISGVIILEAKKNIFGNVILHSKLTISEEEKTAENNWEVEEAITSFCLLFELKLHCLYFQNQQLCALSPKSGPPIHVYKTRIYVINISTILAFKHYTI